MSKQITETERLILLNQYEILLNTVHAKHQDNYEHYKYCRLILKEGSVFNYHELFSVLKEEIPRQVTIFVYDLFNLYQRISDFVDDEIMNHPYRRFQGFYEKYEGTTGNVETNKEAIYSRAAKFLFNQQIHLAFRIKGEIKLLPKYQAMVNKCRELCNNSPERLKKDDILEILNSANEV